MRILITICLSFTLSATSFISNAQWTSSFYGNSHYFKSVAFFDQQKGIASAENRMLVTTDQGTTWAIKDTLISKETGSYLLSFPDADTGYATSYQKIYKTINKGEDWTLIKDFANQISNVHFINADTGFVCANLSIYKTIDGGANWTKTIGISCYKINSSGSVLYGLNSNTILISIDFGVSWQVLYNSTLPTILLDIKIPAKDTLYAVTAGAASLPGKLLCSYDNGVSWGIKTSGSYYSDIYCPNGMSIMLVDASGSVQKSIDGGTTWHFIHNSYNYDKKAGFCFLNKDTGFVYGYENIYKTSVGGSKVITELQMSTLHTKYISTRFVLKDPVEDTYDVTFEYSTDNKVSWQTSTLSLTSANPTTGLSSSFSGTTHYLIWDSYADNVGKASPTEVWLRITPHNSRDNGIPGLVKITVDNTENYFVYGTNTENPNCASELIQTYDNGFLILLKDYGLLYKLNPDKSPQWTKSMDSIKNAVIEPGYPDGILFAGVKAVSNELNLYKLNDQGGILFHKKYPTLKAAIIYDIVKANDNGFVFLAGSVGYDSLLFFKTDIAGNLIWRKNYAYNSLTFGSSIYPAFSRLYAVGDTSYVAISSKGLDQHSILLKIDNNGNRLWEQGDQMLNTWRYNGYCLDVTSANEFILPGVYEFLNGTDIKAGYYDSEGTLLRSKIVYDAPTTIYYNVFDIIKTHDGNFIIIGDRTYSSPSMFVMKISENGDVLWNKDLMAGALYNIIESSDKQYYVVGFNTKYSSTLSNVILFSIDENGTITNTNNSTLLPQLTTTPSPILKNKNSTFTFSLNATNVVSYSVSPSSLPPGLTLNPSTGEITGTFTQAGKYEVTVTLTNAYGDCSANVSFTVRDSQTVSLPAIPDQLLSNAQYVLPALTASSGLPVMYSIITTPSSQVAHLIGNTIYFEGEGEIKLAITQSGDEIYYPADTLVLQFSVLDPTIPTAVRNATANPEISIYPIPASDVLHITSSQKINKLELFDASFKKIATQKSDTNTASFSIASYEKGIYYLVVLSGQTVITKKIIVD